MARDGMGPLAIEYELLKEKATTLRRLGERLELLGARLTAIEAEASRTSDPVQRWGLVKQHRALREELDQGRWAMLVQREAMGLSHHEDVDRFYPLPPRLQ